MSILTWNNNTEIFEDMSEQNILSWDGSSLYFSLGLALALSVKPAVQILQIKKVKIKLVEYCKRRFCKL